MGILHISSTLLILVLVIISQTQADLSACHRKEKHLAALDLARESIAKAKALQPTCVNDSEDVQIECGGDAKVSAYLDFALNLIDNAKANYSTCDVSKDHTKVVTDKNKDITKVVTDEPEDITEKPKEVTEVVTDEPKEVTKGVLHNKPIDCSEILENGESKSGEYMIWPKNQQSGELQLKAYCDMDTDGGGWTVIQRRGQFSSKVDFYRNWSDYKQGFGNILEEFWIGNDNIFVLTNQRKYTVRFDMYDANKEYRFATYSSFRIEDERAGYKVHFDQYSGTAGDGIKTINNVPFSTPDKENVSSRCASKRMGGWWYNQCRYSNPNGINLPGAKGERHYMNWHPWTVYASLQTIEIKIRPEIR